MVKHPHYPYLLFLAIAFLAHGLLLLNDGHYGDGWVVDYYIKTGNWADLQEWYDFKGRPWFYGVFKAIGNVPRYIHNGIIFVNIIVLSSVLYIFMNRFTPLKRSQCLFISFVVLTWPFYHVTVNTAYVPQFFRLK